MLEHQKDISINFIRNSSESKTLHTKIQTSKSDADFQENKNIEHGF